MKIIRIENPWIVLDGTGHFCDQASLYYADKILKNKTKSGEKVLPKTKLQ